MLSQKRLDVKREKLVLMNQTHSNRVLILNNENEKLRVNADAILTEKADLALGVLTADCAPILIYEIKKEIIGCIHAGWKGAIGGIIENTIDKVIKMGGNPKSIIAAVGPCISQKSYNVKKDFNDDIIRAMDVFPMPRFLKNDKKLLKSEICILSRSLIDKFPPK